LEKENMTNNASGTISLSGAQQAIIYVVGVAWVSGLFGVAHFIADLSGAALAAVGFVSVLILTVGAFLITNAVVKYRRK
jgi:1,4-dihydroxy-2-naphthoate octaprenyltransferase